MGPVFLRNREFPVEECQKQHDQSGADQDDGDEMQPGIADPGAECWPRVAGSGPGGQDLPARAWQRQEALPDPRSPQGRIYPLACLIAIAIGAFTAAGNTSPATTPHPLRPSDSTASIRTDTDIHGTPEP